jgi:cytochrome c-type biogenesis protein CcmH
MATAIAALLLCFATTPVFAQVATNAAPLQFRDAAEEQRFHALSAELRCVMCQNQSLADSNAQIAHDLRAEVLALMRQGRSDAQIKQFLVQRYGEFVLYRPQVDTSTWLLWFGPVLLLLGGGVLVWRIVRSRAGSAAAGGAAPTAGRTQAQDDQQEQEW